MGRRKSRGFGPYTFAGERADDGSAPFPFAHVPLSKWIRMESQFYCHVWPWLDVLGVS
jgi:hypothetical protein